MAGKVVRSEPSGISVLISGSGVGGLSAALECWRKGCDVRILERTASSLTSGDSFNIGPSALTFLKHWPEMKQRNDEIVYRPLVAFHNQTGERVRGPMEFRELLPPDQRDGVEISRHSRPKFHAMLLEQIAKVGIQIEYNKEVVEYFEGDETARAGVILSDGSRLSADLVVAADGLRTASWQLIAGHPVPARSSGYAAFRVAYPVERAISDPMVAEHFKLQPDGRSVLQMWAGPGVHGIFWRNQEEMIWGLSRPDAGTSEESWNSHISTDEALKFTATVPGWPEVADRVIKATPEGTLVDWKLMWRDPQPKWTSPDGHVVQLGDAAHTFLPSSGNGGTQAIEDAVSLATCLSIAGKDNIADAVRVHNLLRFERVSFLQALGIANREVRTAGKQEGVNLGKLIPGQWLIGHDPEQYAIERYAEARAHLKDGTPFKNTNTPSHIKYRPWTIDSLVEAMNNREHSILSEDWT